MYKQFLLFHTFQLQDRYKLIHYVSLNQIICDRWK